MWEPVALCCFTRRTGCLVLGSLEVIGAILGFIMAVFLFALVENNMMDMVCSHTTGMVNKKFGEQLSTVVYGFLIGLMISSVIQCVCSSMMIHGVRKNNHCLMGPFLIKNLICIILHITLCGTVVAFLSVLNLVLMIVYAYFHGAVIFMWTYFLLTVRAYYHELKRGKPDDYHQLTENCQTENGQPSKL
ncbi:hypothetical protein O3P69_002265 [Scylla paramamosain]|uniref:Uncharacterized protein n=2 Tax=Scylla paramamosain TaxID=85552 RepID=A0AAW0V876_SCYPA